MCVRCVDRYPQLLPSINKQDSNGTSEEVIVDKRRRTSECVPPDKTQQQGTPPGRSRSGSLPSQKPRIQQRSLPTQNQQQRADISQQKPTDSMQAPRPDGLQQNISPRPPQPQQIRPRYPNEQQPQQKPHQASGHMRPSHPNGQQRFPHPNEQQRPLHPPDQQRPLHPPEQQRPQQPINQQRPLHPTGQQRHQTPIDQQRPQHPVDPQRPHHPGDLHQKQQIPDQQKLQHEVDNQQIIDKQKQQYANGQQNSNLPVEHRSHTIDSKNQNNLEQRNHQSSQPHKNSVEQQRSQNSVNNQKEQSSIERKSNNIDPRTLNEHVKPTNAFDQQRHLQNNQRPPHPSDIQNQQHIVEHQRFPAPMDQPRPHHPNEQIRTKHSGDQYRPHHPIEQNRSPYPADQRNQQIVDQRFPPPHDQLRLQHPVDQKQQITGNNIQHSVHKPQYSQDYLTSQNHHFTAEKEPDFYQQQVYPENEPSKPRPQHPILHPQQQLHQLPEGTVQNIPPKNIQPTDFMPQRPQGPEVHQMIPPPRNQRVREPPEQQITPRPQHPQQAQGLLHYPEDIFQKNNSHPLDKTHDQHIQDKFQNQQEFSPERHRDQTQPPQKSQHNSERIQSKQINGKQYPSEILKNGNNQYPSDVPGRQQFENERDHEKYNRSEMTQKQFNNESLPIEKNVFSQRQPPQSRQQNVQRSNELIQQSQLENDKNGLYVSLNEQIPTHGPGILNQELQRPFQQHQNLLRNDNAMPTPPATLPRTKPPEIPQPASRSRRDKPSGTQTLPRTGTNPFRTDTNPFRKESLPAEAIDAGEYVTVAPRRGSLDERIKSMSSHDQNRLNEVIKVISNLRLM